MNNNVTYAFEKYVSTRLCFLPISEANVWNVQNLLRVVKIRFLAVQKKVLRVACIANKYLRANPWH